MQTSEQLNLYKDLLTLTSNPVHFNALKTHALLQYNIALNVLKKAKDPAELHVAQGEAKAWERIINLQQEVLSVLKGFQ